MCGPLFEPSALLHPRLRAVRAALRSAAALDWAPTPPTAELAQQAQALFNMSLAEPLRSSQVARPSGPTHTVHPAGMHSMRTTDVASELVVHALSQQGKVAALIAIRTACRGFVVLDTWNGSVCVYENGYGHTEGVARIAQQLQHTPFNMGMPINGQQGLAVTVSLFAAALRIAHSLLGNAVLAPGCRRIRLCGPLFQPSVLLRPRLRSRGSRGSCWTPRARCCRTAPP